jgi:hypothetical protein
MKFDVCPFCGAPATLVTTQESAEGDCHTVFEVGHCGAYMTEPGPWGYPRKGDHPTKEAAQAALAARWNRRATRKAGASDQGESNDE